MKAPYGTWDSVITAEAITKSVRIYPFFNIFLLTRSQQANGIADVIVDRITSEVYHIESRPSEAGRNVLIHTASKKEIFGADYNVRSGVQEYGGAAAIVHNNIAYFSNLNDGCVYRVEAGGHTNLKRVSPGKHI